MAAPSAHETQKDISSTESWKNHPDFEFVSHFVRKLRNCEFYQEEHKECTSWGGRFRQRYVYGESVECNHFANAHKFCKMYRDTGNEIALDFVIQYELSKRDFRFECAKANDVWEYRTSPPEEWKYPGVDTRVVKDLSGYEPLRDVTEEESSDLALIAKEEERLQRAENPTQSTVSKNVNNSAKKEPETKSSSSCVIS